MTVAAAIRVEALEKLFPPARSGWRAFLQPFERPSVVALAGVSFDVHPGEAVALLGANGAGKSTLLRILATLILPTHGRALVANHDAVHDPRAVRRQLGYHAGSDQGFYARLTGRENLRFFGRLNHLSGNVASRRISQLAAQFRLDEALDRQARTLSSGTVQRLSLARALLHRPRVLLLDEPTRSLDAIGAAEFRRFLKAEILRPGDTSLLFASHSLAEVELLADRIAVMNSGRLITCDTLSAVKHKTGGATLEEAFIRLTGGAAPLDVDEDSP
ncbi:MAG TPA: ABC transporter ATP-binding protein [Candidatus Methylomirabilis sp.]|nr:ABC transporter ATP-binding protein [Candidatus Methylomirabilis sp.]